MAKGQRKGQKKQDDETKISGYAAKEPAKRESLPDTRASITHKAIITDPALGEMHLFLTVGLYEDKMPGELFAHIGKQGTTLRGLMDTIAIELSLLLQYGVPLAEIVEQFKGTRFEPMGKTSNRAIPECHSLIDYIVRWLELTFKEPL
ncbi:hypothetical protein LCGC14_0528990 [marine sediment metagenome]|uniref:ribonucleoside-diphosphate reductase n=1 Tax=marine sediment metagenome TaxID=412755 RepID=A0A0F9RW81_9ZZZZ